MNIAVVGSMNMDMAVEAERIPLKGETLIGDKITYFPGGKGANQAYAIARFGAEVSMYGCVGNDENGRTLIDNLKNARVETGNIKVLENVSTGLAIITVGDQDNTIIVVPGANAYVDREYIDSVSEQLKKADIILMQQEIPAETVEYVVDFCKENNITVILNPAPAREISKTLVEKLDYLTPNEHEAALIFGDEKNIKQILTAYPEKLIITRGEHGVDFCRKNGRIQNIPARKVSVRDTTGAGDTFNGILTAMLAEGADLEAAVLYGNTGAGLSTEKSGAQSGMPTRKEIEGFL